jgi:ribosomal protein S18 acetylase RimI-like enzyme
MPHLRVARPDDRAAITQLLERSYPTLMKSAYSAQEMAACLPLMTKANPVLLASETYYVVCEQEQVLGAGGWSWAEPGTKKISPGLVHIRHFAVDPSATGRGLGRQLFQRCLDDIAATDATTIDCQSSLNAVEFYRAVGLQPVGLFEIDMGEARRMPAMRMQMSVPTRI